MLKILFSIVLALGGIVSLAEETSSERATREANEAKRSAKKAMHRTEEATCAKGDMKCTQEKASHRGKEAKDFMKDKADEAGQKMNDRTD